MFTFEKCKINMLEAICCPDVNTNPFILLQLGQSFQELKEKDLARDYLMRAYMIEGNEIFENEEEKYFDMISDFRFLNPIYDLSLP